MNKNSLRPIILFKTISWYFFHFLMVSFIGLIITSEWATGIKLASAELLFEGGLFYWHEHLWKWIRKRLQWN